MKCMLRLLVLMMASQTTFGQDTAYNKYHDLACHNCFESGLSPSIEDALKYTTAIELDIWDSEVASGIFTSIFGGKRMDSNWYVKHTPKREGNCCGGSFRDCLKRIKDWSDTSKDHSVITVFIDKKENWSGSNETRKPADLDKLLLSIFPRSSIFTPADLKKDMTSLKAATAVNWPDRQALRNKIIFVITDASLGGRKVLTEYLDGVANAVCFVAPEIGQASEITQPPKVDSRYYGDVVFYNLKYGARELCIRIDALHCLSRVYNGEPEEVPVYRALIEGKANFVAMKKYRLFR